MIYKQAYISSLYTPPPYSCVSKIPFLHNLLTTPLTSPTVCNLLLLSASSQCVPKSLPPNLSHHFTAPLLVRVFFPVHTSFSFIVWASCPKKKALPCLYAHPLVVHIPLYSLVLLFVPLLIPTSHHHKNFPSLSHLWLLPPSQKLFVPLMGLRI
jgi:hypothetical protein